MKPKRKVIVYSFRKVFDFLNMKLKRVIYESYLAPTLTLSFCFFCFLGGAIGFVLKGSYDIVN